MAHLVMIGAPPSIEYITNQQFGNSGTPAFNSRTFTNVPIGDESPDRIIILCVGGQVSSSGWSPSAMSASVGGTSLTRRVSVGPNRSSTLFSGVIPTGTTASITVADSAGTGFAAGYVCIAVYAAYNCLSATPVDTAGATATGTQNLTLSGPSNGVFVGFVHNAAASTPSYNWVGLSQDFQASSAYGTGVNMYLSGASKSGSLPASISVVGGASVSASFS